MNFLGIGSIIEGVGKIADDLITSDEERLKVALQEKQIDAALIQGQLEINKAEAEHKSIFVAGWRPAIGWVGAAALAYQFLLYPLLTWALVLSGSEVSPPDLGDTDALYPIILGMLGIGGMRSFDKSRGTQTDKIRGD